MARGLSAARAGRKLSFYATRRVAMLARVRARLHPLGSVAGSVRSLPETNYREGFDQ